MPAYTIEIQKSGYKKPVYRHTGAYLRIEDCEDGDKFFDKRESLSVITSVERKSDGKDWLHVSLAHAARMPTYKELCRVKDVFIGKDEYALQVFAETKKHVNIHPWCLHLWHCVDGWPLPDFTDGKNTI